MRLFGRKAAVPRQERFPLSAFAQAMTGGSRGGYESEVRSGYMTNPIGQRAVRMVSEGVGHAPIYALPYGHPLGSLLDRPSPGRTRVELLEALAAYLLLAGNAYVEVVEGADGAPAELHALRPERVTIEADARGWPSAYLYRVGGSVTRYPVVDGNGRPGLCHIRTFNPLDDHYGLGCLGAAAQAVATHNAAASWGAALLQNSARPSGALVYEPKDGSTLSPEQFERLRAEMEQSFTGAVGAGRPMLLEGGLRWQAMSLTPAELDFAGARAGAAREIALAFGVPPMLLGLPGDLTYQNYAEANRALWRLTLLPMAERLCAALSQHLSHWWPDASLAVDRDLVPALALDREALWAQVGAAAFLTDAEKREMLGIDAGGGAAAPAGALA